MTFPAIRAESLAKRFGDLVAVDGVTFEVLPGELFGFLGPNGAGKTTTIKMMVGLLRPTAGKVAVAGFDLAADPVSAKARLGYVPDEPALYDKLTGREFLRLVAAVHRMDWKTVQRRVAELLELFDLSAQDDDLLGGWSHGMRQKVALAAALLHEPEVLVLDEPTVGLDPRAARLVKDILREFCRRGRTVFMSTHILEIAEAMCDRVAIIDRGRLVAVGTVAELRDRVGTGGSDALTLEDVFLRVTGGAESADTLRAFWGEDR